MSILDQLLKSQQSAQQAGQVMQAGGQLSPAGMVSADPMAQPMTQPQGGIWGALGGYFSNPDNMDRLAMGFNTMRLTPDSTLQAALGSRINQRERRREVVAERERLEQQQQERGNRTAAYFRENGMEGMAKLIEGDPRLAGPLLGAVLEQQMKPGPEQYLTLNGAQLEQMGIKGADPNKLYSLNGTTGKVTAIGGGGTEVNINNSGITPGFEALDKAYAKEHIEWTRGGGADMKGQLAQVDTVLGKLENGEQLTGPAIGAMPNFVRAVLNPEAQDSKEQIEEVVQRNLRLVLGAQFTEKEGSRLIERAYNPSLTPEYNIRRLRRLYQQMSISAQQRDAMAEYFAKNGTLQGYTGPQPNIDDFYTALSKWEVGQVINGYRYLGGDPNAESSYEKVQ